MNDQAAEDQTPDDDAASVELWARLNRLAGMGEDQRSRSRSTYELMYDVLEGTASEKVLDAAAISTELLKLAGVDAAAPETRPRRVTAILTKLREMDLGRVKPRQRVELLEEVIGALADGTPDLNQPLARIAVEAVGPYFQYERRTSAAVGPGGRHGNKKLLSVHATTGVESVFRDAAALTEKIVLDVPAYRFLRQHSRLGEVDEAAWAATVRQSIATGKILDRLDYNQLVELAGQESVARAFESVEPGTLFLMFHCGFIRAAKRLFTGYLPRSGKPGLLLAPGGTHQAADDPRQALFGALRSLQSGHNLWVAPDGSLGKQSVTFNVLGTTSTGGEGGALLAHTARCPTAFYRLVVDGERLVPVVEPGPLCEKGESYKDFRDRFHRAYEDKLAELLTGDPADLVVRPRWLRVFAAADQDAQAD